ncbi:Aste57867_18675 [Aphanomyces stellatus]|uniref:Aste57867_18675 protein n=1 Tax=Aphanomyces stellatus TaxID=120398 RepID=A0A485LB38_9STRA|nr:hypothetical protein As57867_018613 [Aphanomyces stellatus]VFT95410.1 Aste57867_18675 [Aphanomyces stellatus]
MSRLDNIRSLASQAGQTIYSGATVVASVSKEKGRKAYATAAVAASAGRSTLETRLKQVQTSSTYKTVKQKLWSKNGSPTAEEPVQFASTEKEYYKVDPTTIVKRSKSNRDVLKSERPPKLTRSATSMDIRPASREQPAKATHDSNGKRLASQEVEF